MLDFSEWPNQRHSEDERMLICDAVRRRNAAARVHGDSSQRQALKAGCRIDLRLGCRPERTQDIAAGQQAKKRKTVTVRVRQQLLGQVSQAATRKPRFVQLPCNVRGWTGGSHRFRT
jgi:hypothetical protein